jgi:choice-of-anchor B domain-containing protein
MKKIYLAATLLFVTASLFAQYNFQLKGIKAYNHQLSGSWGYTDTINNKEYALVGTIKGLSIVDITTPTSPVEVKFINGTQGTWRECQTWSHYAYITQDNSGNNASEGVLIYDLTQIPNGKVDTFIGTTANDVIKHNHSLYIDEKGFLYLNGGNVIINGTGNNGVAIYDLKPNPKKPVFVGYTPSPSGSSDNYVHDCFVRNDTMFQAHIYNTRFTVWDVRNRATPVLLKDYSTSYSLIHNMWLSNDSKTLFVTHEQFGLPAEAYDISDLNDIHQLCEFRVSPTNQEIAHNVHVLNDYLICSYYSDGVAIFDALDPSNVVPIGYYDTQPLTTRTEYGVWGAYGFYKSGLITLSDMKMGLYVVKPAYIRAARIQGVVTDSITGMAIAGAKITFVDTTISSMTTVDGLYKTGTPKAGTYQFKAEKSGYTTKYFNAQLLNGQTAVADVQLSNITTAVRNNISGKKVKFTLDNSILNILNTTGSDITELDIYNSAGSLTMKLDQPETGVSLTALSKDMYILQAITSGGQQYIEKIVIY